jgi:hypothetical protein
MFFLVLFTIAVLFGCVSDEPIHDNDEIIIEETESNETPEQVKKEPLEEVYKWSAWKDLVEDGYYGRDWSTVVQLGVYISFKVVDGEYRFYYPYREKMNNIPQYRFRTEWFRVRDLEVLSTNEIIIKGSLATLKLRLSDFVGDENDPLKNPALFFWVTKVMEVEIIEAYNSVRTELNSFIATNPIFYK